MKGILRLVRATLGIMLLSVSISELIDVLEVFSEYKYSFGIFYFMPETTMPLMRYWLYGGLGTILLSGIARSTMPITEPEKPSFLKGIMEVIQKGARFSLIGILILFLSYTELVLFRNLIPFPMLVSAKDLIEGTALYIYVCLIPLLLILKVKGERKIFVVPLAVLALFGSFVYLGYKGKHILVDSEQVGQKNYHLQVKWRDWPSYTLYKCNRFDLGCASIYWTRPGLSGYEIIANEALNELYLFRSGGIQYVFGNDYSYDAQDALRELDSEGYPHVWVMERNKHFRLVMFFVPANDTDEIVILPVEISIDPESDFWRPVFDGREWGNKEYGDIYVDLKTQYGGKGSVYVEDVLIFSYGLEPLCHIEGCKIVGSWDMIDKWLCNNVKLDCDGL